SILNLQLSIPDSQSIRASRLLIPVSSTRMHLANIVCRLLLSRLFSDRALKLGVSFGQRCAGVLLAVRRSRYFVANSSLQPLCILVDPSLISLELFVLTQIGFKSCQDLIGHRIIGVRESMLMITRMVDLELGESRNLPGDKRSRELKNRLDPNALKLSLVRREFHDYVGLNSTATINRASRIGSLLFSLLNGVFVTTFQIVVVEGSVGVLTLNQPSAGRVEVARNQPQA